MTRNVEQVYQNALLADATYIDFKRDDINVDGTFKDNINLEKLFLNRGFSGKQFEAFISKYKIYVSDNGVVAHQPNTLSGFSATIFEERKTHKLTVAFRGTEPELLTGSVPGADLLQDVVLALGLSTTIGKALQDGNIDGFLKDSGLVDRNGNPVVGNLNNVNFVGHSLGGHLALMAAYEYPGLIDQGYTYNGAGIAWLDAFYIDKFSGGKSLDTLRINNFYAKPGVEFTSSDIAFNREGHRDSLFIEKQGGNLALGNHSMQFLVDALSVHRILDFMGGGLSLATIDDMLWQAANREVELSKDINTGNANINTLAISLNTVMSHLATQLGGTFSTLKITDSAQTFYEELLVAENSFTVKPLSYFSDPVATALMDPSTAGTALRYTLLEGASFVVIPPSDYTAGIFNQQNDYAHDIYSEQFWTDRLDFHNRLMARNQKDMADDEQGIIIGDGDYHYDDHFNEGQPDANGPAQKEINIQGRDAIDSGPRIIFGSENSDSGVNKLEGSDALQGDHIYGAGGNDTINGGGGNDYIEGNADDDTLHGNAGTDNLYGGKGKDMLYGDAGMDHLFGGKGNDIYYFESGDGHDFITDNEGINTLMIGGRQISQLELVSGTENNYKNSLDSGDSHQYILSDTGLTIISPNGTDIIEIETSDVFAHYGIINVTPEPEVVPNANDIVITNGHDVSVPNNNNYTKWDPLWGRQSHAEFDGSIFYVATNFDSTLATDDWEFWGSAGNDQLTGGIENDTLQGNLGDDKLVGAGGDDQLYGHSGKDTLAGGEGVDVLVGGLGSDNLSGGTGNDFVFGNGPFVEIDPETGNVVSATLADEGDSDYLEGNEGNDWLSSGKYQDTISGGAGKDKIFGGAGNDVLSGGTGDDFIMGDSSGNRALYVEGVLGTNVHTFTILDHIDVKEAGLSYNDVINGGAGNDTLIGEIGDDHISGGDGDDFIEGDKLNDSALFGGDDGQYKTYTNSDGVVRQIKADDFVALQDPWHGNDTLSGGNGNDTVQGNGGNDVIHGDAGDDFLLGDDQSSDESTHGDDVIFGGAGLDQIQGGGGQDELHGGSEDDTIFGETGNDQLFGDAGNDQLQGGAGEDVLIGGSGDDMLYGGEGNDTLIASEGGDILFGGAGNDTYVLGQGGKGNTINDNQGKNIIQVENGNSIQLTNNDKATFVVSGSHYFAVSNAQFQNMKLVDNQGVDIDLTLSSSVAGGTLYGSSGNDTITGSATQDMLLGNAGSDTIFAGEGDDVLLGDSMTPGSAFGDDLLNAGAGDDQVFGLKGNDQLNGGAGNDWLEGGEGNDTYTFDQQWGNDTVIDSGPTSKLVFTSLNANELHKRSSQGGDLLFDENNNSILMTGNLSSISSISFADGVTWSASEVMNNLSATSWEDKILLGNQTLPHYDGGDGADIYSVGAVDGIFSISDSGTDGTINKIRFDSTVDLSTVSHSRSGQNLLLSWGSKSLNNQLTVENYYLNEAAWELQIIEGTAVELSVFDGPDVDFSPEVGKAWQKFKSARYSDLVKEVNSNNQREDYLEVNGLSITGILGSSSWGFEAPGISSVHFDYQAVIDSQKGNAGNDVINLSPTRELIKFQSRAFAQKGNGYVNAPNMNKDSRSIVLNGPFDEALNSLYIDDSAGLNANESLQAGATPVVPPTFTKWSGNVMKIFYEGEEGFRTTDYEFTREMYRYLYTINEVATGAGDDIVLNDYTQIVGDYTGNFNGYFSGENSSMIDGGAGNDWLGGGRFQDFLYGGAGDDWLAGGGDAADSSGLTDYLYGGDGNDRLSAGFGNDVLSGGNGADILQGEGGADTYLLNTSESGIDLISDYGLFANSFRLNSFLHEGNLHFNSEQEISQYLADASSADQVLEDIGIGAGNLPLDIDTVVINTSLSNVTVYLTNYEGRSALFLNWDDATKGAVVLLRGKGDPLGYGVEQFKFNDVLYTSDQLTALASSSNVPYIPILNEPIVSSPGYTYGYLVEPLSASTMPTGADNPVQDETVAEGTAFNLMVQNPFLSLNSQIWTYSATLADGSPLPSWLSFADHTLALFFSGTPSDSDVGDLQIKLTGRKEGEIRSTTFHLNVANINDAPQLTAPILDQSIKAGDNLLFVIPSNSFSDIDVGDVLSYRANLSDGTPLPEWLHFDQNTQSFIGTASSNDIGSLSIEVTATDSSGVSVSDVFNLLVERGNSPPTLNKDIARLSEDSVLTIDVLANDVDAEGDSLKVEGASALNGLVAINTDGTLNYTPNVNFNGNDTITYHVNDGNGGAATSTVTVTVDAVNDAPTAENDTASTQENMAVTIDALANDSDLDGDSLTITSASSDNAQVTINSGGTLNYVPNVGFNGDDTVNYQITDGSGGIASASVSVIVTPLVDNPMKLTGTNHADILKGGKGNDHISARRGKDQLFGYAGDDVLIGGGGSDHLYGGDGVDHIRGNNGADHLFGGRGNDVLVGGKGNDTYHYLAGDGFDRIKNRSKSYASDIDIVSLDSVNDVNDVWFKKTKNNLDIYILGGQDHLRVNSWFKGDKFKIDNVNVGGQSIDAFNIDQLVSAMAAFGAPSGGAISLTIDEQQQLNTAIAAAWQ